MGHGKERNRIRDKIPSWGCLGHFGYGHGRAMREFGDKPLKDKSVCFDLCPKISECRDRHHAKMDKRFPSIAKIVDKAAKVATESGRPVIETVVLAMRVAEHRGIDGTKEIRRILNRFGVQESADHYVCGQLENIQKGFDGAEPSLCLDDVAVTDQSNPEGSA